MNFHFPSFDVNQDAVTEPSVNATTAAEEEGDSSTALPNSSEEEDGSSSSEEVTVPSVDATTAVEKEVVVWKNINYVYNKLMFKTFNVVLFA